MEEKERLKKHLEYLCSFDKLTGEPEALQAVAYISDVLKKYGVSCHTETFPAYLSNPVSCMDSFCCLQGSDRCCSFSVLDCLVNWWSAGWQ